MQRKNNRLIGSFNDKVAFLSSKLQNDYMMLLGLNVYILHSYVSHRDYEFTCTSLWVWIRYDSTQDTT